MATHDQWMPLYVGSYLGDTAHLTYDQHGPYLLLLMAYWRKGPLPDDDRKLAAIARVPMDVWLTDIGPVLREFFSVEEDGLLHQKRADVEREKRLRIAEDRAEAGRIGATKRWRRAGAAIQGSGPDGAEGPDAGMANAIANAIDLPEQTDGMVQVHNTLAPLKWAVAQSEPVVDLFGEAAPPKPSEHAIRSEGMELLAWIAGQSDPTRLSKLMNATISSAGGDRDLVLQALRDTHANPAKYANIATLKSLIAERMPRTPRTAPKVVVDNTGTAAPDPWGIQAWCSRLPGVKPTQSETERQYGNWALNGEVIDYWATEILQAIGFPEGWRGDLSLIEEWSRSGACADDVAKIVRQRVATSKEPITSLRYFQNAIQPRRRA